MEKVLYVLWAAPGVTGAELRGRLLGDVAPAALAAGARGIQVNVDDEDVAPAARLRLTSSGRAPAALVSVWLDSAIDRYRRPADAAVGTAAEAFAAYLVTESVPIRNTLHPPADGVRTAGFAQLAFLTRPSRLGPDEWRRIWHDDHTPVAIDIQATFGYAQNAVVRPLTEGAPAYAAVVEELFPAAAMTDRNAFYAAAGDDERARQHERTMIASSSRFLDFDAIDVVPTSQYVVAVGD